MSPSKRSRPPKERKKNARETVYLNSVTQDQLNLLGEKYPRRSKSDIINAAIEHLFLSGYEQGLDGNLLPINPTVYRMKDEEDNDNDKPHSQSPGGRSFGPQTKHKR